MNNSYIRYLNLTLFYFIFSTILSVGSGDTNWEQVGFQNRVESIIDQLSLWEEGELSGIIQDKTATEGKCAWMSDSWGIQWHYAARCFAPKIPYTLHAVTKCKVVLGKNEKVTRFSLGVHPQRVVERQIAISEIQNGKWQTFKVGTFYPGETQFSYVSMNNANLKFSEVFLDKFYFVPQLNEQNIGTFTEWKLHVELEEGAFKDENHKPIASSPWPDNHFAFGVGSAWGWERLAFEKCTRSGLGGEFKEIYVEDIMQDAKRHYCNFVDAIGLQSVDEEKMFLKHAEKYDICVGMGGSPTAPRHMSFKCEADFKRQAEAGMAPFVENSHLVYRYTDEPCVNTFKEYLQAKKVIEKFDPKRPYIGVLNLGATRYLYGRYMQLLITDVYQSPWGVGGAIAHARNCTDSPVWWVGSPREDCPTQSYPHLKPYLKEVKRLSVYQAIANGAKGLWWHVYYWRPMWNWRERDRSYAYCLVDAFGTPSAVWEEIGRIGKCLTPVGQLLTTTSPVENSLVTVETCKVVTLIKQRDAVGVALLEDRADSNLHYLVALNNDIQCSQKAKSRIDGALLKNRRIYDLYSLSEMKIKNEIFDIALLPGDGIIYAMATPETYLRLKNAILLARLQAEKGIFALDFELAKANCLSLAPVIRRYNKVLATEKEGRYKMALEQILECQKTLTGIMQADNVFKTVSQNLNKAQKMLSNMEVYLKEGEEEKEKQIEKGRCLNEMGRAYWGLKERLAKGRADVRESESLLYLVEKTKEEVFDR
ncbi:MAG: hypothetical protein PHV34_08260 [Verrucomicrobiae bacterium]|nr:hypothetical protein [Verrucomicrobiae bacterium]